jgi:hypothetical protein
LRILIPFTLDRREEGGNTCIQFVLSQKGGQIHEENQEDFRPHFGDCEYPVDWCPFPCQQFIIEREGDGIESEIYDSAISKRVCVSEKALSAVVPGHAACTHNTATSHQVR